MANRDGSWEPRVWTRTALSGLLLTLSACSPPTRGVASAEARAASSDSAPRQSNASTTSSEVASYCEAAARRRDAFRLDLSIEVRGASLSPREGYALRELTQAEQVVAGQPQLFLSGESVVTGADLSGAQVYSDSVDGRFEVSALARSPTTLTTRLQPLVGGSIAVLVDGRLLSFAKLQTATIRAWPVASGLTLEAAQATAARLGPSLDLAALEHLDARCLRGEGELCPRLAEERLVGRDAPWDPARAATLYEAGCRAGVGAACTRAAELTRVSTDLSKLLERGCSLNDAEACIQVAAGLLHDHSRPDAKARGRELLARSCERSAGRACTQLAEELGHDFKGDEVPPPETQIALLRLFEQGCSGGDAEACFICSEIAREGAIGDADPSAAKRWLEAGCKLDPSGGSLDVSARYAHVDPALLAALKDAGCNHDSPPLAKRPALCGAGRAAE